MASVQCQKPSHHDQTNQYHEKPTTTTHRDQTACHNNNNNNDQHSFGKKVKEMAQSVGKMFHHNQDTGPKPTNHHGNMKTDQNKMEKTHHQGHEGHCMQKMRDRIRNMKTKKKMHTKDKYSDSDSSSSDSDNENSKRKH